MSTSSADLRVTRFGSLRPGLLRAAAIGGLLGGAVLFLIMAGYNAAQGMGFWSILNSCFAAFVFKSAQMTMPMSHAPMSEPNMTHSGMPQSGMASPGMSEPTMPASVMSGHPMTGTAMSAHQMMSMGNSHIVASHVIVGGLLHLAMSIGASVLFALVLALLIRAGVTQLAHPLLYVLGGAAGGALLYVIMMEIVAPNLNRTIVDSTPRLPFFLAHLAYGAVVAGYTAWRIAPAAPARPVGNRLAPA